MPQYIDTTAIDPEQSKKPTVDLAIRKTDPFDFKDLVAVKPKSVPVRKKVFNSDEDPFNLLDVHDTYDVAVAKIYQALERYAGTQLNLDTNRDLLKEYYKTGVVRFPAVELDDYHSYSIIRSHNDGMVQYRFVRANDEIFQNGFVVCKSSDNTVLLKNGLGDVDDSEDEEYWHLISHARQLLEKFFDVVSPNFDFWRGNIPQLPSKYKAKDQVASLVKKSKGSLFTFTHPKKVIARGSGSNIYGPRQLSRLRAISIPVACLALWGGVMMTDNIVNGGEHARQNFDSTRSTLSAKVITMGHASKPELGSVSQTVASDAPELNFWSSDKQNFDGIRALEPELASDSCQTIYLDTKATDIKAVTDSQTLANSLTIKMSGSGSERQVSVCNTSDDSIYEDGTHLWVAPV